MSLNQYETVNKKAEGRCALFENFFGESCLVFIKLSRFVGSLLHEWSGHNLHRVWTLVFRLHMKSQMELHDKMPASIKKGQKRATKLSYHEKENIFEENSLITSC